MAFPRVLEHTVLDEVSVGLGDEHNLNRRIDQQMFRILEEWVDLPAKAKGRVFPLSFR